MQLLEAIHARRSTRTLEPAPVSREVLEAIVECGLAAPSSKNAQPWRMHIVTGGTLEEIAARMVAAPDVAAYAPVDGRTGDVLPGLASSVRESAEVLRSASVAIVIENLGTFSGGRRQLAVSEHLGAALVGYTFEVLGLGAAIQNLWLAATVHGLDGVFVGDVVIAEASLRSEFGLRGDLVGALALGHAAGPPPASRTLREGRVVWHS